MDKCRMVTIELTEDQRSLIRKETGVEVTSLKFDALEDRVAPSAMIKQPVDPRLIGAK